MEIKNYKQCKRGRKVILPWLCPTKLTIPIFFLISFFALTSQTNGQSIDFRQAANNSTAGTGRIVWINSILQQNNSIYFEGMSVPQRIILTDIPETDGDVHTLTFSFQSIKASGGSHAYDFLTSWDQAMTTANTITGDPLLEFLTTTDRCAENIGPPANLDDICEALHTSGFCVDVNVPDDMDDPTPNPGTGTVEDKIAAYESLFGNRTIRICGNEPITNAFLTFNGYTGNDQDAQYTLTWTSESDQIIVELAGHLASGEDPFDPAIGWGAGFGSSSISGGPYHFNVSQLDGASLGSQDNQIKGADIQVPPPNCGVDGPRKACPETESLIYTYTGGSTGVTFAWSLINNTANATISGLATGSSITVTPNPDAATADFTPGGSFNVQLIVTKGDQSVTCFLGSSTTPGDNVVISNVQVTATATPSTINLNTTNQSALSATVTGAAGTPSFQWTELNPFAGDDVTLSNANTQNATFTINNITGVQPSYDFEVLVTDADGCVDRDTVTVIVTGSAPPCLVNGPSPVCPGSTNVYIYDPDNNNVADPIPGDFTALWKLVNNTNGATTSGSLTGNSVTVNAAVVCNSAYTVRIVLTSTSGLIKDSCEKTVSVDDDTPPVITCPDVVSPINCPATPTFGAATATDNCDPNVTITFEDATTPGCGPGAFSTTRTWTATDDCGNTSTCSRTIEVVDVTPPTITCPDVTSPITCPSTPSFGNASATDACDPDVTITSTDVTTPGPCPGSFTITRTFTATDDCGNTATCSRSITVDCPCEGKGCTPGFWKNHTELWDEASDPVVGNMPGTLTNPVTPGGTFITTSDFWTYFGIAQGSCGLPNTSLTMLQAASLGGGGCNALARHGVSALLNAAAFGAEFPFPPGTTDFASLYTAIQSAFASCNCTSLAVALDVANNNETGNVCSNLSNLLTMAGRGRSTVIPVEATDLSMQVYPNPYRGTVNFRFVSPVTGNASLEVYDLLGQRLKVAYTGMLIKGEAKTVYYTVPTAAGGIIYRLRVGDKIVTGKVFKLE